MTKREYTKALSAYPSALTVPEVAEILRVSTKTVYKLLAEKTIPSVKIGREHRVAKALLIDYLYRSSRKSSAPVLNFVWTCEKSCGSVRAAKEASHKREA